MNKVIKLKIKGSSWKIKFVNEIDKSDDKVLGLTLFNTKTIYVLNNLNETLFEETLTHELLHATLYECGSNMCYDEQLMFLMTNAFNSVADSIETILLAQQKEIEKSLDYSFFENKNV